MFFDKIDLLFFLQCSGDTVLFYFLARKLLLTCILGTKILNQINVVENTGLYMYHKILGIAFI